MRTASCPRSGSSQKTAGAPVARARVTARCTQSRTGASCVVQARQMSPVATSWDSSTAPGSAPAPSTTTTSTVPSAGMRKVLSWLPYSSALRAMRPTLGTEPMVAGSRAPWARQSSMTAW